jgi:DNA-directed RNA polymerase specialized sigma24 family protein
LFDLERIVHDKSIRVVASRQVQQQAVATQRDIYDSHRHRVFAVAFYMTGSELEAEQILTTTFVEAFRGAAEPQAPQIDGALVGKLREYFPLGALEPMPDLKSLANQSPNLSGRNVRRTDLEEAIQELPPTERLLFLLRDVEGYSPAAISQLVDMPEAKVQRALFSARIRLRQVLAASQAAEPQAA